MRTRIGGRNWTWVWFLANYAAKFAVAPVVAEGWPHQCRCGTMTIIRYRGRNYCRRCGKRWIRCPYKINGKSCDCGLE